MDIFRFFLVMQKNCNKLLKRVLKVILSWRRIPDNFSKARVTRHGDPKRANFASISHSLSFSNPLAFYYILSRDIYNIPHFHMYFISTDTQNKGQTLNISDRFNFLWLLRISHSTFRGIIWHEVAYPDSTSSVMTSSTVQWRQPCCSPQPLVCARASSQRRYRSCSRV